MHKKFRRVQTFEFIDGFNYIMERGEKILTIRNGTVFNGSKVAPSGRFATCENCGIKHAVGLRCAVCSREKYPAKKQKRGEHKDIQKPDNIRGS